MTTPQWMSTLSLALEIPFDSKEDKIWSKLIEKYSKFSEIFITSLSTIDIVRLPFIDFSFIKYFFKLEEQNRNKQITLFNSLQSEFQTHLKQRVNYELLDLQQKDHEQFKTNLNKLLTKVSELQYLHSQDASLSKIVNFLKNFQQEIQELEDGSSNEEPDPE